MDLYSLHTSDWASHRGSCDDSQSHRSTGMKEQNCSLCACVDSDGTRHATPPSCLREDVEMRSLGSCDFRKIRQRHQVTYSLRVNGPRASTALPCPAFLHHTIDQNAGRIKEERTADSWLERSCAVQQGWYGRKGVHVQGEQHHSRHLPSLHLTLHLYRLLSTLPLPFRFLLARLAISLYSRHTTGTVTSLRSSGLPTAGAERSDFSGPASRLMASTGE